jgi:exodeoxyribonuclease VII large subunit
MPSNNSDHIYTVTELTRDIRGLLESNFGHIWVSGEVSNYRLHSSGHIYFTLKDEESQLSVALFKNNANRLRFKIEDGLQLNVEGRISVYERRGNYQLIAVKAEPVGYGALQLAFEQLKKRLGEEGLFDEEHKKPVPRFPQKIGVVTSPTGAAIRDILNVIDRRFSTVEILLYPSSVQGEGAAAEIAGGIITLDGIEDIDVIIIGRGGGSIEDLWAFNEEPVARAIFECETPIVSAVGHEIDFTISDFVADLRAPTPSAAAELVVRERDVVIAEIAQFRQYLSDAVTAQLTDFGHRLELAVSSYGFRRPSDMLLQYEQRLDDMSERVLELQRRGLADLETRISTTRKSLLAVRLDKIIASLHDRLRAGSLMLRERIDNTIAQRKAALAESAARLDSMSPLAVLARGYSIAYHKREIIKDSSQVQLGDYIRVRLHKGALGCTVEKVED